MYEIESFKIYFESDCMPRVHDFKLTCPLPVVPIHAKVYIVPKNDLQVNNKIQDDHKLADGIGEVPETE